MADIHPLSPDDAAALLAAAKGQPYEHLFALLLTTGLRLGEALALCWKPNVDLDDARTLTVRYTLEWLPRQPSLATVGAKGCISAAHDSAD